MIRTISFLIFFFAQFNFVASAQWVQSNGPYGGEINEMIVSANFIYASTNEGIFSTSNQGQTWNKIFEGYSPSIAAEGNKVVLGNEKGVYISNDNGKNWKKIKGWDSEISNTKLINAIAISGNRIFVSRIPDIYNSNDIGGLFYTSNNGLNWNNISNGISSESNKSVDKLVKYSSSLFAGTCSHDPNEADKIYMIDVNGNKWKDVSNGYYGGCARAFFVNGDDIFIGTDNGIYKSSTTGWKKLNNIKGSVYSILVKEKTVYIGTPGKGIYKSLDYGISWSEAYNGLKNLYVNTIVSQGNKIFAGTRDGIYVSSDNGKNWVRSNNGLTSVKIKKISENDNEIVLVGEGVFTSIDSGVNWKHSIGAEINDFTWNGDLLIAAAGWEGILTSKDNGVTWKKERINLSGACISNIVECGGIIFATDCNKGLIYYSNDNLFWQSRKVEFENASNLYASNSNLFSYCYNDGVYISKDYGKNWQNISENIKPTAFIVNKNQLFIGVTKDNDFDITTRKSYTLIYNSIDNGKNWNTLSVDTLNSKVKAFVLIDNRLFVNTNDGIYYYSNNSKRLINITSNLPSNDINSMEHNNKKLLVNIKGMLWQRDLEELNSFLLNK